MAPTYALVRLDSTPSTQDEASARFSGRPVLAVAAAQTRGRGRGGRDWQTAPRALAASLALAPRWPAETWPRLSLVAALAARAVLEGGVDLKWPNDLLIKGKKVGGVLVEAREGTAVVGLGVNLWWPSAPAGVAGLLSQDPGPARSLEVAEAWGSELLRRVDGGPDAWGHDEYREACVTLGSSVRWEPGGTGTAEDVDTSGALVVRTRQGKELLRSGEVWEVRPITLPSTPTLPHERGREKMRKSRGEHPAR
ncbi:MAG: biotin--[acetyl-CoA-carboxylase] ligase [Actinomycetota bacterium]|nr:biotin--[acetyl-CoA-carboxylase] ligase [Actinomycetota bacterium]